MDRKLEIGSSIVYVDPHAEQHPALVTAVWGSMGGMPGCNLVYVVRDESKTDNYGRQIERSTSITHKTAQPAHGNYWMWADETPNPLPTK
jgi:hypothetical protein